MENRAESKSCPIQRFIASNTSMAYGSGDNGDPLLSSEEFVRDESNLLSLHPWIFKKESYGEGMNASAFQSRGCLRSGRPRRFPVKPVNFPGNYINTPFAEHLDVEDYVLSSPPNSPTPRLRPFVVTDGSRIISRSGFDCFSVQAENGLCEEAFFHKEADGVSLGAKRAVIGVPVLPDSRKLRRKSSELRLETAEVSNSPNPSEVSQMKGAHDRVPSFCIGISIGIISGLLLKRTEVDKLNKLLKQTEDLVQDLQEELEMKGSLSVKELANGTYESQKLKHWNSKSEESTVLGQDRSLTPNSTSLDEHDQLHLNKAGGNSESLSKIEAELEAELERLEQSMNDCSLEQRMSHLIEFDPDLIADVVRGELRADNLAQGLAESQDISHDHSDTDSTTQTYNANYCVSPKELSLRLHQVIQSRLEERIEELERELLQSQRQRQVMEAERDSSRRTFSNSDMGFSSNQDSPRAMQANSTVVHPFCLNLSGDALDAYDEAYQEFMQMTGKEESSPPPIDKDEFIDECKSNSSRITLPWENILWSRGSDDTPLKYEEDDDKNGSFSDEEGKALIQQLVEKTKRGSPAVINAQRMFLLLDETL